MTARYSLVSFSSKSEYFCLQVCGLTGPQLDENERSKIMLTDQVKKIETQYRHDAKNALLSQMKITNLMYSLGTEMTR